MIQQIAQQPAQILAALRQFVELGKGGLDFAVKNSAA